MGNTTKNNNLDIIEYNQCYWILGRKKKLKNTFQRDFNASVPSLLPPPLPNHLITRINRKSMLTFFRARKTPVRTPTLSTGTSASTCPASTSGPSKAARGAPSRWAWPPSPACAPRSTAVSSEKSESWIRWAGLGSRWFRKQGTVHQPPWLHVGNSNA